MKTAATTLTGLALAGCLLAAGSASAAFIETGTYRLHNHPAGNEAAPAYGLRLDNLLGEGVYTFDFDAPGAEIFLDYDGSNIHIHGTAFGGLDVGDSYDPEMSSFVDIDFTYGNVLGVPGDDDLFVSAPNGTNSGSITWLNDGESIGLTDYHGDNAFTFRFGDESNNLGHRGFPGLSGWGWLKHGNSDVQGDFIFTAELVPTPGALALLGLGGLVGRRRRRR